MQKKVIICSVEELNNGWPSKNLLKFREWLDEQIEDIPEEYRKFAEIEIDAHPSYEGTAYANIEIVYVRPETEKEKAERIQAETDRVAKKEQEEKTLYERLKLKYGA